MTRENYINIIKSLSVEQFRQLVRIHLQLKERAEEVRISDGTGDGGCDFTVVRNGRVVRKTIQATVQKTAIDDKFRDDLDKAKANVDSKGFLTGFYFFISQPISQEKQNEWDVQATDKGIDLLVYDAKALADMAVDNIKIGDFLKDVYLEKAPRFSLEDVIKNKNLYDVLALGNDAANIRLGFLKSYAQAFLFDHPNSNVKEITAFIDATYGVEIEELYIKRILKDCCKGDDPMLCCESGKYSLTDNARINFESIRRDSAIEECQARDNIAKIFSDAGYPQLASDAFKHLEKWYRAQYNLELTRLDRKSVSGFETIETRLEKWLLKFIKDGTVRDEIIRGVVTVLSGNAYFNKIGRTHLFHSLLSNGAIDNYLDVFNKVIFLDTQVLLQLICVLFAPEEEYNDFSFNTLRNFRAQVRKMGGKVRIATTSDYLDEVSHHLADARRLRTFIDMQDFDLLGGSKNVFVSFYLYLRNHASGRGYDSMDDFLSDLLGEGYYPAMNDKRFTKFVNGNLCETLEEEGIEIKQPLFLGQHEWRNEMTRYEKMLYMLGYEGKSKHAKKTDLNMMLLLDSDDVQTRMLENRIITDSPFLVTWDATFAKCLEKYLDSATGSRIKGRWYVYSPSAMTDRLALATLELDPGTINYDIIRHAEGFYYNGQSFLDVLSQLINPERGLGFTRKMIDLKRKQLGGIENDNKERNLEKTAIDKILEGIYRYYSRSKEFNLENVQSLSESEDSLEAFVNIIISACDGYREDEKIPDAVFESINNLIKNNQ